MALGMTTIKTCHTQAGPECWLSAGPWISPSVKMTQHREEWGILAFGGGHV